MTYIYKKIYFSCFFSKRLPIISVFRTVMGSDGNYTCPRLIQGFILLFAADLIRLFWHIKFIYIVRQNMYFRKHVFRRIISVKEKGVYVKRGERICIISRVLIFINLSLIRYI